MKKNIGLLIPRILPSKQESKFGAKNLTIKEVRKYYLKSQGSPMTVGSTLAGKVKPISTFRYFIGDAGKDTSITCGLRKYSTENNDKCENEIYEDPNYKYKYCKLCPPPGFSYMPPKKEGKTNESNGGTKKGAKSDADKQSSGTPKQDERQDGEKNKNKLSGKDGEKGSDSSKKEEKLNPKKGEKKELSSGDKSGSSEDKKVSGLDDLNKKQITNEKRIAQTKKDSAKEPSKSVPGSIAVKESCIKKPASEGTVLRPADIKQKDKSSSTSMARNLSNCESVPKCSERSSLWSDLKNFFKRSNNTSETDKCKSKDSYEVKKKFSEVFEPEKYSWKPPWLLLKPKIESSDKNYAQSINYVKYRNSEKKVGSRNLHYSFLMKKEDETTNNSISEPCEATCIAGCPVIPKPCKDENVSLPPIRGTAAVCCEPLIQESNKNENSVTSNKHEESEPLIKPPWTRRLRPPQCF